MNDSIKIYDVSINERRDATQADLDAYASVASEYGKVQFAMLHAMYNVRKAKGLPLTINLEDWKDILS